jgi:hypothetical protein
MCMTLSMKWAASEKWYTVTHCLVAFLQCTETSKTVSESSSSFGSLCSNSCSRSASVGTRGAGFSCLLNVEETGDFYLVFEMSLWIWCKQCNIPKYRNFILDFLKTCWLIDWFDDWQRDKQTGC